MTGTLDDFARREIPVSIAFECQYVIDFLLIIS